MSAVERMNKDRNIHIVIPCYNEEDRLPFGTLLELLHSEPGLRLTIADDGSTDGTRDLAQRMHEALPDRILVHGLVHNMGKAEAVRQGMLKTLEHWPDAEYIGYFDADMATPISEAFLMRQRTEPREPMIILGSRVDLLGTTDIQRSPYRHYFGRVFATMVSMQLGIPVYDTQCGAKLIRADHVRKLFDEPFLTRWLFDVELLWRCMALVGRNGMREHVAEVPLVRWHEQGGSKVRITDAIKVPFGLWRVAKHYRGRVRK